MALDKKGKIYKLLRVAGILSFVPFVLIAGPLAGYIAGSFLEYKFIHIRYLSLIFTFAGFIAAIMEVIELIRLAMKNEKGSRQ